MAAPRPFVYRVFECRAGEPDPFNILTNPDKFFNDRPDEFWDLKGKAPADCWYFAFQKAYDEARHLLQWELDDSTGVRFMLTAGVHKTVWIATYGMPRVYDNVRNGRVQAYSPGGRVSKPRWPVQPSLLMPGGPVMKYYECKKYTNDKTSKAAERAAQKRAREADDTDEKAAKASKKKLGGQDRRIRQEEEQESMPRSRWWASALGDSLLDSRYPCMSSLRRCVWIPLHIDVFGPWYNTTLLIHHCLHQEAQGNP